MQIKKSIKNFITLGVALPALAAFTIGAPGFFIAQTLVAQAATTTVVTSADLDNTSSNPAIVAVDGLNKWFMYNDTNDTVDNTLGSFVTGPSSTFYGTGSIQFALGANPLDRKNIATYQFSGTPLASITAMSFGVYSHSGVAGANEDPYLNFNVDFTGTTSTYQRRLVYVPSVNASVTQDVWQQFNAINAGNALWSYSGPTWPTTLVGPDANVTSTPGTTTRTWSAILLDYPSARVIPAGGWLGIRVGEPGPTNYTANVDFFSITLAANDGAATVFDFDPTPVVVAPATTTVTIEKYLDGNLATASSTGSASFPLTATWNSTSTGAGTGSFSLGPVGFNNPTPYEATTADMSTGGSYSVLENASATCDAGNPYQLAGYTTGASLAAAANSALTSTMPHFTNMTQNQFVIVWNKTCVTTAPTSTLKVHIVKYLNGAKATASSSNSYLFPMTATWTTANLNGGATTSGSYVLGNNFGGASDAYGADTATMQSPTNYATNEVTNDVDATSKVLPVGASCTAGNYQLANYQTSLTSFADALAQATSTNTPTFLGLTGDAYVIVNNVTCPTLGSLTIEKDTIGGNGTFTGSNGLGTFSITTASGTGSQTFNNLTPGTYGVTETNIPSGWTQAPGNATSVVVTAGGIDTLVLTNTMNARLGEIRGTKYADKDGDGTLKDGDHHRLAGVTIYLDTNNNGVLNPGEPSTVTNKFGEYRFLNLPAGTYYVREISQAGWKQTYPASGSYTAALAAGKVSKNNDFGNFKFGTISGMKFNDLNGNGRKSANELGLAGWTIQLTKLHSTFTTSTVTDANGHYTFANLSAGTYQLREVQQTGWIETSGNPSNVTVISGTNSQNDNFGNHFGPLPRNQGRNGDDRDGNGRGNDR